jgi:hypothetical protein
MQDCVPQPRRFGFTRQYWRSSRPSKSRSKRIDDDLNTFLA